MLRLTKGAGPGQPNEDDDIRQLSDMLERIGEFERPGFAEGGPLTTLSQDMVDGMKRVQRTANIDVDGYALPGGPTEHAINNIYLAKPRGASLYADPDTQFLKPVGDGFDNDFADVKRLRRVLGAAGYLSEHPADDPSGFFDKDVQDALTKYQNSRRLRANGWVRPDDETAAALAADAAAIRRRQNDEFEAYYNRAAEAGDPKAAQVKAQRAMQERGNDDEPRHTRPRQRAETGTSDFEMVRLGLLPGDSQEEQNMNQLGQRGESPEQTRPFAQPAQHFNSRPNDGGLPGQPSTNAQAKSEPDKSLNSDKPAESDDEAARAVDDLIARHRRALTDQLTRDGHYRQDYSPLIGDIIETAKRARDGSAQERERALAEINRRIDREVGANSEAATRMRNGARSAFVDPDPDGTGTESLFFHGALGKTPINEAFAELRNRNAPKIESPRDALKPDDNAVGGTELVDPNDPDGRIPIPLDRRIAVRGLISRMYRIGARGENGAHSLSDDDYGKYLADAKAHISEKHFPIFELTARAVREGLIPWDVAAERLTRYFAPESTGEAITDTLLDLAPIVGQVKAAAEIYELLEKARDAAALGDKESARKLAEMAALAAAGLVPLGGFGAMAKTGAKNFARAIDEYHWHHVVPRYLAGHGGLPTTKIAGEYHRELHRLMQQFMRNEKNEKGQHMAWSVFNWGTMIQNRFSPEQRIAALNRFHRSIENDPRFKGTVEVWRNIFPELRGEGRRIVR